MQSLLASADVLIHGTTSN